MSHDDPRRFPSLAAPDGEARRLYALVERGLGAATMQEADACDAQVAAALGRWLAPGSGSALAALLDGAPSAAIYRHLWRALARCERSGAADASQVVRLFAMPVVIVAGIEDTRRDAVIDAVVDATELAAILKQHRALGGNETLSLASALVTADALDFAQIPELLASRARASAPPLSPAAIDVAAGSEAVHLRFLLGTALAAASADIFRDDTMRSYGVPFARALSKALAVPGVSVLALPRPPLPLVEAQWQGRIAQREVAAQVFASNAIRRIRAATGEPSAVISVHVADDDPRSGEVRLSLSSPFDPRAAEGFRCRLWPLDRIDDVVAMLTTLLADCRVTDVQRKPGVHPDRDALTGAPLLFKPEPISLH